MPLLHGSQKPSVFLLPLPRKALTMAEIRPAKPKRPTCPGCSRPSRLCLCARIKIERLENPVAVTVLQHSLEKKHPLNSARIALLGLKNATLSTVSDVSFEARFDIRLLESKPEAGSVSGDVARQVFVKSPQKENISLVGCNEKCESEDGNQIKIGTCHEEIFENEGHVITAKIGKQGVVTNFDHIWTLQNSPEKPNFETILEIREAVLEGFVVEKFQMRQREASVVLEERSEFEIEVPRGSVLLFPSEEALCVEGLKAIDFEVKNLIVLDGTWAKAKRMYKENPWLKLVPHLKLEVDKVSLYNGVRLQPKAGCLSTIESIVYALKALGVSGDNLVEGLDELLGVFESMVGDQRECKDKRLRIAS